MTLFNRIYISDLFIFHPNSNPYTFVYKTTFISALTLACVQPFFGPSKVSSIDIPVDRCLL